MRIIPLVLLIAMFSLSCSAEEPIKEDEAAVRFVDILLADGTKLEQNFRYIDQHWQAGYAPMAIEILGLARRPQVIQQLVELLHQKTDQKFGRDTNQWYFWLWNHSYDSYSHYPRFKSLLYGLIDEKFAGYFGQQRKALIRLDEVRWGGVKQDGIPPLRQPQMISADAATYLDDDNVIFGVKINGDARAYPKRILAWHEMFVDEIGGTKFIGVYCTLCGAVILYETVVDGVEYHLGTSGFLFRSNKLMYDKASQSLWNTTWGEPVVGPLADKGIRLKRSYLVTTTWGEWKKRHPDTSVLSLETGFQRDYGEGVAYRKYFSNHKLMFNVPKLDQRLGNKDEVLALIFAEVSRQPLAIAADFLVKNPLYYNQIEQLKFVVLTDSSGANRVYKTNGKTFVTYDGDTTLVDDQGVTWQQRERALVSDKGEELSRLPAHRAFWFGWYAANNDTRLIY